MGDSLLTIPGKFKCKVSTTLQPSSQFASKHMFDDSPDSCWNSDQGSPQWILLDFQESVSVSAIAFTFQGGFVGQEAEILSGDSIDVLTQQTILYSIVDSNDVQRFPCSIPRGRFLKIVFPSSTDFYGRVTIYSLQVFGERL